MLFPCVELACICTFTKGYQCTDLKIQIYDVYAILICWTSMYTLFYESELVYKSVNDNLNITTILDFSHTQIIKFAK